MLTLDQAKKFLRVDFSEDDAFISSLIPVSEKFVINATHPNADRESGDFQLAQMFLISHWYENRNTVLVGTTSKEVEFTLSSLFSLIRYTSEDAI